MRMLYNYKCQREGKPKNQKGKQHEIYRNI